MQQVYEASSELHQVIQMLAKQDLVKYKFMVDNSEKGFECVYAKILLREIFASGVEDLCRARDLLTEVIDAVGEAAN